MASGKDLVEFPEVEAKLQMPTKKSAFEKQKAEAEAKRQRQAAETAAVYKDFVKSFDRDDDYLHGDQHASNPGQPRPRDKPAGFGGGGAAASRRHFGAPASLPGMTSGRGGLGAAPSSYVKKRGYDTYQHGSRDRDGRSLLGFEGEAEPMSVSRAFDPDDDDGEAKAAARAEEMAVARPTLRLAHLPPGTSPAVIKALMPPNLTVENVKIMPPSGPSGTDRKCTVAIVTLSQETPANEIDAAVSSLQNRYLGYGYHLSLHRHLSSAVTASTTTSLLGTTSTSTSHPFGAKPVSQPSAPTSSAQVQTPTHRGFAPPSSYGPPSVSVNRSALLHVPVHPPSDIRTLQLINKTIESVLEHGPEFEALLMTRPEVQREERWSWIWDARSEGGVWYRWRLWEIVTGSKHKERGMFLPLFDGGHAWKSPDKPLAFEYTADLDKFISDSEYNSSDGSDYEGEATRENSQGNEAGITFLNPLEKAKLTHLLARLPMTLSRVRKGDIARVTTFALTHASRGADEVVGMILSNIEKPFSLTGANPNNKKNGGGKNKDSHDSGPSSPEPEDKTMGEATDTSAASLVGLYVVSDILSSSSTSGLRHAWRFRQLFEGALRERKIFECLGTMADRLKWGRLRAEKWKRSVGLVLGLWDGWCVFPAESQELFVKSFEYPLSLKSEDKVGASVRKGKWKTIDASAAGGGAGGVQETSGGFRPVPQGGMTGESMSDDEVRGEPLVEEDVGGEPVLEEDIEGEPMSDGDVAGEPMDDGDDIQGEPMDEDQDNPESPTDTGSRKDETPMVDPLQITTKPAGTTRKRMRAVDTFADSSDSESDR